MQKSTMQKTMLSRTIKATDPAIIYINASVCFSVVGVVGEVGEVGIVMTVVLGG